MGGLKLIDFGDKGRLNAVNFKMQELRESRMEFELDHLNPYEVSEFKERMTKAAGGLKEFTRAQFIEKYLQQGDGAAGI